MAAILFVAVAFIALTLPDHPGAFSANAFMRLPLELPLLGIVLLILPRRLALGLGVLATAVVVALLFLKIADIGVQSAFQRRFNPYLDIKMLSDGWNLLSGTVGSWVAGSAIAAGVTVFLLLGYLFFWSTTILIRFGAPGRRRMIMGFAVLLIIGFALQQFAPTPFLARVAGANAFGYLSQRLDLVSRSVADMRIFEAELQGTDKPVTGEGLFQAVAGRDIILVFIESYGRSAIEDPRYGALIAPRLTAVEEQIAAAGFHAASGWNLSPTVGGLSWLAHGTFLSGLWVDSQARYDRLMISQRPSLNRLFREAGWKTTAVMPAITMDWPEGAYYGYDQILAHKDLGYQGRPFNWVTMPDQYTLSAFERLGRIPLKRDGSNVMAEIALISSHAPWTPVATLIDWDDVGDGSIFTPQAESGDPPSVVWADPERVRAQYVLTVDYALHTLGDYIARFGDDAVFIILGDHQPAAIITGPDASRAVPIHVVSRDRSLVDRFLPEGFAQGMVPGSDLPERPMNDMREMVIRLFSQP
ncbi:sulfatase (plasmid) [Peteryoungia desertarenae]|uniref:Sulfatase n=1 Tax=Peteryoungia desertarenae TaxID=1813451 RepID=A0ABX6QTT6_9HYPH|nr:sulfatase [Peteryoungia desertarenae]